MGLNHVEDALVLSLTIKSKLEAGIGLLELANKLLAIKDASLAVRWLVAYNN